MAVAVAVAVTVADGRSGWGESGGGDGDWDWDWNGNGKSARRRTRGQADLQASVQCVGRSQSPSRRIVSSAGYTVLWGRLLDFPRRGNALWMTELMDRSDASEPQ